MFKASELPPDASAEPTRSWLIVGLGNVGARYTGSRHNIGFAALDHFVELRGSQQSTKKSWKHGESAALGSGLLGSGSLGSGALVLACWPSTFMNLSGDAVQELVGFYRFTPAQTIVLHDDIDLPCGKLRIRKGGGDGGQKGVRSIIERTGSADFIRIKIGVGRPADVRFEIADWVLSKFSQEETPAINQALISAAAAVGVIIERGVLEAQNQFNRDAA